jgi:hypothetical protein
MDTDTPPQIQNSEKPTEAQLDAMSPTERAMHLTGQAADARIEEARRRLAEVQAQADELPPAHVEPNPVAQQPQNPEQTPPTAQ